MPGPGRPRTFISSLIKQDSSKVGPSMGSSGLPTDTETSTRDESDEFEKPVSEKQTTGRVKTFILYNNKPIAMQFDNEGMLRQQDQEIRERKVVEELEKHNKAIAAAEERRKTYHIWNPHQRRRSIVVQVGDESKNQRIFETRHIQKKTYTEWKKEARANLPSAAGGGTTVNKVEDVIKIATAAKKETDQRKLDQAIKRISQNSQEHDIKSFRKRVNVVEPRRHASFKVDESTPNTVTSKPSYYDITESHVDTDLDEISVDQKEGFQFDLDTDLKSKIRNLREFADHISQKKVIRQKLIAEYAGAERETFFEKLPLRENIIYVAEYIHNMLHDFFNWAIIWEKDISEINGRFGTVVASYFIWLRRIFYLSLLAFTISFFLIMVPEFIEKAIYPEDNTKQNSIKPSFEFGDLLHGGGYFEDTWLFYSGYQNRNPHFKGSFLENAAVRFALAIFAIYVFNSWVVMSRVAKFYHSTMLESHVSGVSHMTHFKRIVCAWEFRCRHSEAAICLHKSIARDLAILARDKWKSEMQKITEIEKDERKRLLAYLVKKFGLKWGNRGMHMISSLFLVICCVLQGGILFALCDLKLNYYIDCVSERDNGTKAIHHHSWCDKGGTHRDIWIFMLPSLFASISTFVLSNILADVGEMEIWDKSEWKVLASMMRSGLFNFTSLGLFYIFWLAHKGNISSEGYVSETIFGQELYRLVIIQGLLEIFYNIVVKYLYHFFRKRKNRDYKRRIFPSEHYAQQMFFLYPVFALGTMFCPPISFVVCIRLVIDFYWHKYELLNLSSKETYDAHASVVYAPYLFTFVLYHLFAGLLGGICLTKSSPSQFEGPFVHYNNTYDEVLVLLLKSKSSTSWLGPIESRGTTLCFLVILIIVIDDIKGIHFEKVLFNCFSALIYFCREWALAYVPVQEALRELIFLERGDKDLLLKAIFEIGNVTADVYEGFPSSVSSAISINEPTSDEEDEETKQKTEELKEMERNVDHQIDHLIYQVQRFRRSITNKQGGPQSAQKGPAGAKVISDHRRRHQEQLQGIIGRIVDQRRKLENHRAHRNPLRGSVSTTRLQTQGPSTATTMGASSSTVPPFKGGRH